MNGLDRFFESYKESIGFLNKEIYRLKNIITTLETNTILLLRRIEKLEDKIEKKDD